jgi:hypothetical protein
MLLGLYLLLSFGEYTFRFGQTSRTIIFWGFIAALFIVSYLWIVKPLLKLWRLRKSIDENQAALIIGTHFKDIEDRLLNLLQLEQSLPTLASSSLAMASIEQKTKELRPIPFHQAINIRVSNKKWFRLAAIPIILIGCTLIFQSSIITDGTKRIVAFNQDFPIPAPFKFILENKSLHFFSGDKALLKLKTEGKVMPNEAYAKLNGQKLKMKKDSFGHFSFEIEQLKKPLLLQFEAAGFTSKKYSIQIKNLPRLLKYSIRLNYPKYTGIKNEKVANAGELNIPEGTRIVWDISAKDAERIIINNASIKPDAKGMVQFSQRVKASKSFSVRLQNKLGYGRDSTRLSINAIPDYAPNIQVETIEDSSSLLQYFFLGNAGDDYQVNRINFLYRFSKTNDIRKKNLGTVSFPIKVAPAHEVAFTHGINLGDIGVLPGEEISFFLEAWDNNGIRGSQVTRTPAQILRRKTAVEVRKDAEENANLIKNSMAGGNKKGQCLKEKKPKY